MRENFKLTLLTFFWEGRLTLWSSLAWNSLKDQAGFTLSRPLEGWDWRCAPLCPVKWLFYTFMKLLYYGPFCLTIWHIFLYSSVKTACHTWVLLHQESYWPAWCLFVLFPSKVFFCYIDSPYTPKTAGESCGNLNDPNKEALAKTEVSLTLTNKFDVPGDENAEMDARTILLKWVLEGRRKWLGTQFTCSDHPGLPCPSQFSPPCIVLGTGLTLLTHSCNLGNPPLYHLLSFLAPCASNCCPCGCCSKALWWWWCFSLCLDPVSRRWHTQLC